MGKFEPERPTIEEALQALAQQKNQFTIDEIVGITGRQPQSVQVALRLHTKDGSLVKTGEGEYTVQPDAFLLRALTAAQTEDQELPPNPVTRPPSLNPPVGIKGFRAGSL